MTLRDVTVRNRAWLPPMDQYSVFKQDGIPTDWHYQHYVSRAVGGFGLVLTEATAVSPEGRISPNDVGLWNDAQQNTWKWIADGIAATGAVPGIQLNHSGRKGSTGSFAVGFNGASVPQDQGGWPTLAPSSVPFGSYAIPTELSHEEIHRIIADFRSSAARAVAAGFKVIEIHAAHGYLISQFLDPLSNLRTDEYGGDLNSRLRFLVEVSDAIREVLPEGLPLFVRISATDWAQGGWDLDQTVSAAQVSKRHGVDLIDVSTGGIVPYVTVPVAPNYQVPFAAEVRAQAGIPTTAVGLIDKPKQAERILHKGWADAIEIGRAALREPSWPLRAAHKLGLNRHEAPYPQQYLRGAYRDNA
ncbi:MAG: NADH:flavin oxidoreductase/NADH oxidase [Bifidobacteriaceae bacterium]|jgi:2,4-dienoyl-CoA reductase-like NADH-dependent reductase (Old Yellow Enzyme family)|nr:NADH:flavin oxidoreductase/NADH oxidase [Bifidobacteriaceae bacterium]MCI1914335.1 NADH:flavin oxidoreductase/NADH oxidase [Bifidobacteriaceae bacterium]